MLFSADKRLRRRRAERLARVEREEVNPPEERILNAAAALFAERGYAGATTRAIAQRAEVDQALVFEYFPRKESLLEAVALAASRRSLAVFEVISGSRAPAPVKLYAAILRDVENVASAPKHLREILALPELRQPKYERIAKVRATIVAWYRGVIEEGVTAGDFEDTSPTFAGWLVNGLSESPLDNGPGAPNVLPHEYGRLIADFSLRSLLKNPKRLAGIRKRAARLL